MIFIGKTTTISALTGMIKATSGDVSIYGFSLTDDLPAIRQMTGIWYVFKLLNNRMYYLESNMYYINTISNL